MGLKQSHVYTFLIYKLGKIEKGWHVLEFIDLTR